MPLDTCESRLSRFLLGWRATPFWGPEGLPGWGKPMDPAKGGGGVTPQLLDQAVTVDALYLWKGYMTPAVLGSPR